MDYRKARLVAKSMTFGKGARLSWETAQATASPLLPEAVLSEDTLPLIPEQITVRDAFLRYSTCGK